MKERDKCRIRLFFLPEREKSGGGVKESPDAFVTEPGLALKSIRQRKR